MSRYRIERAEEIIKANIGGIIQKEIDFPGKPLVTVTKVKISDNMYHVDIFVSVLPNEALGKSVDILRKNIYHIQKELDKMMPIRPVPQLRFVADLEPQKIEKIDIILEKIKKQKAGEKFQ